MSTGATVTSVVPPLTEQTFPALAELVRGRGLVVGAGAIALGLVIGLISPATFFPAYLAVYLFFLGLGIGSLALLMLHYLVGGLWGFTIRRPLEATSMTLPVLALLFLPIALAVKALYPWANAEVVNKSVALLHKSSYLNIGFWLVRALIYHAIWSGLALALRSGSRKQDETDDPAPTWRTQALCAPGLILVFFSVTFAMIDWGMSLEPEWYSTIYGVMLLVGFGLSALCLAVTTATHLRGVRPLADVATAEGFHDLGNLMLAFVMLWAYMSFSQYLVTWMGNLAEEAPWYIKRSAGGWWWLCGLLIIFHFFAPFFLLLIRENKRESTRLWRIAVAVLGLQLLNDIWLIVPALTGRPDGSAWYTLAVLLCVLPAVAGIGGLWAAAYAWLLGSRPLLPRNDPMLAQSLAHHDHGGGGH
jgi:hypothetical protein